MLELHRTVLWQRFWRDVIRSVWPVLTRFNFMPLMTLKKITACKVLGWASFMLFPEAVIQFYAVSTAGGLSLWSAVAIKTRWNGDDGEIAVTFRIMRKICVMFFSSFLSVVVSFTRVRINGSLVKESCWLSHVYIKYRGQ